MPGLENLFPPGVRPQTPPATPWTVPLPMVHPGSAAAPSYTSTLMPTGTINQPRPQPQAQVPVTAPTTGSSMTVDTRTGKQKGQGGGGKGGGGGGGGKSGSKGDNLEPAPLRAFLATLTPEQQQALSNDPDIGGQIKNALSQPQSIHEILHPATATTDEKPIVDPLAVQLFFAQTIAPYLNSIGDQMRGTGKQYAATMNQLLGKGGNIPEAYRGVLAASVPQNQANYDALAASLQGAAVAGPALDQLNTAINEARNAQIKRYYAETAGAGLGGGGTDLASLLAGAGIGLKK